MKLLQLMALLAMAFALNAQDNSLVKKPITLDLKPDFDSELNRQTKITQDKFGQPVQNGQEQKNIFEKPPKYKVTFGLFGGNSGSTTQEGIQPLTIKNPLRPGNNAKQVTVFEK